MQGKPNLMIIGGGIIGITIAREAALSRRFSQIKILEKEQIPGLHASSRNSGVIHSGFYYSSDTKKAEYCSEANTLMRDYVVKNLIPHQKCGKVVVSNNSKDDGILEELLNRGNNNNSNIKLLPSKYLDNYEKLARSNNSFLWSPNTWSASPRDVLKTLIKEILEFKIQIITNKKVIEIGDHFVRCTNNERFNFDYMVNASGAYALDIAIKSGLKLPYKSIPFKGLYLKSKNKIQFFRRHIYPVPEISMPFLGIHTTLTYDGYLKLGPTAIPALSAENYDIFKGIDLLQLPDLIRLQLNLFINNDFNFRNLALREVKFLFKRNIIKEAQKLTKYILNDSDFDWYSPGIRAQLYNFETKSLEMDFIFKQDNNILHLLNSVSPAWTCSFKTAKEVIKIISQKLI